MTSGNVSEHPNGLKDMSLRQKYKNIIKSITVEPMLLCYVIPSTLNLLAIQNLNLDKACRVNMNYGDLICDTLRNGEIGNYTM